MAYWFYVSADSKAVYVHHGDCFTCKNGKGREGQSTSNWIGPYETKEQAFGGARSKDKRPKPCVKCQWR